MRDVGGDLPARALDPLLDLHRELVHLRPGPHRHRQPAAGLPAGAHPVRDRLVITARKLRRPTQRASQSNASRISITSSELFKAGLLARAVNRTRRVVPADQDKSVGRTDGHQRGDPTTASVTFKGRLQGDSHGRRYAGEAAQASAASDQGSNGAQADLPTHPCPSRVAALTAEHERSAPETRAERNDRLILSTDCLSNAKRHERSTNDPAQTRTIVVLGK